MTQDVFQNTVFIHKDKMYRFAKSILRDDENATDLVQEVMLKLWQQKEKLEKIKNREAFAMRCIRNEALNMLKRTKVAEHYQESLIQNTASAQYPMLTKELVLGWIQDLPEKQKMVMHLRDVEEYEIDEIMDVLKMKESAVRVNLMRARQKIKDQLNKVFDYEKGQLEKSKR